MSAGKVVSGSIGASKSLATEIERLKFDKRLTDWSLSRKKFSKDDLKKHLDALPDLGVLRVLRKPKSSLKLLSVRLNAWYRTSKLRSQHEFAVWPSRRSLKADRV